MSKTAIVRTCATLNEAYICRGLLQTHGIHASIDNAEHAAIDWYVVQALGGVYVRVPSAQLKPAQDALIAHVVDAADMLKEYALPYEPITSSQRWKVIILWLFYFGVIQFFIAGLIVLFLSYFPAEWLASTEGDRPSIRVGSGLGIGTPRNSGEGLVLMMLMFLIVLWELISTRPEKPKKDPQL